MTLSRAQPQPRPAKANKTARRPFPALTSSTAPARTRDDPPGSLRPPRRGAKAVRPRPSRPRPGRGPGSPVLRGPVGEVSALRASTGPVPGTFDPVEHRCQLLHLPGSRGDEVRGRVAGHRATLSPPTGPERPRAAAAGAPPGGGLPAPRPGLLKSETRSQPAGSEYREVSKPWHGRRRR